MIENLVMGLGKAINDTVNAIMGPPPSARIPRNYVPNGVGATVVTASVSPVPLTKPIRMNEDFATTARRYPVVTTKTNVYNGLKFN